MGASVRIEDEAFSDVRYDVLARVAGLADADHARGKMSRIWRQCTIEQRHTLPASDLVAVLGERAVEALVAARLGDDLGDGTTRLHGTKGRIEWLKDIRKGARNGGKARSRKALRDAKGRLLPSSPGLDKRRPAEPALSSAPAPAPAPAPAQEQSCSATRLWPSAIGSVADLEVAVADWHWNVTGIEPPLRQWADRLTRAGPIAKHEYAPARDKANGKKTENRVAYFLGVVEGQRNDAAKEAARPSSPPVPKPEEEPLPIYLRTKLGGGHAPA